MKRLFALAGVIISLNAFCQGQLQKEASGSLAFVSDRVMQLANTIPSEKYAWSPQSGVRSFAGVFAHIVSANYFFATKLGAKLPAGVEMESIETKLKTKEEIATALKQSYELIVGAVKNAKDAELSKKVEYPFPGEFTNMSSILISLSHSNEHLGQLIAYSRMNGIKPPWSE
jgi:uncharacterized damage-inducible protein DinB